MPIETVPGSELQYYLIVFDDKGQEREEAGEPLSKKLLKAVTTESITDIFIFSHGWLGDVPAARRQYNKWLTAMAQQKNDIDRLRKIRPDFKPLLIGLHWPSLPWGNEELEDAAVSFAAPGSEVVAEPGDQIELLVTQYAERLADTEASRQALRTILTAASADATPPELPPEVQDAYGVLQQEAGLATEGEGAAPRFDRDVFDPEQIYERANFEEDVSFGDFKLNFDRVLAPLRTLSFWKMKDRARTFGETGGSRLLAQLQQATDEQVRFHLMGHSFGCIVVSAILAGKRSEAKLLRPVDTVALVQGALSLWSYCSDIPVRPGRPGYFHALMGDRCVKGPIITTQSVHDTAVGIMYPLGAGTADDVDFGPGTLPTYGGLGTWGAQGPGVDIVAMPMLPADKSYSYETGKIYNLDGTTYICDKTGGGLGGAHSDIAKPEVAHAFWEAILAT